MRPIDADAIPYTMLYKENWLEGTGCEKQGVWKSDIDAMPTIEERKTGKWMELDFTEAWEYRCDQCGRRSDFKENFCPSCGADMRGVKDDNN